MHHGNLDAPHTVRVLAIAPFDNSAPEELAPGDTVHAAHVIPFQGNHTLTSEARRHGYDPAEWFQLSWVSRGGRGEHRAVWARIAEAAEHRAVWARIAEAAEHRPTDPPSAEDEAATAFEQAVVAYGENDTRLAFVAHTFYSGSLRAYDPEARRFLRPEELPEVFGVTAEAAAAVTLDAVNACEEALAASAAAEPPNDVS